MSICELDLFLTNREGAKSAKEEKRREEKRSFCLLDGFRLAI